MTTKKLLLAALLACTFAPVFGADIDEQPGQPRIERHIVTRHGDEVRINFDNMAAIPGAAHRGLAGAMMGMSAKPVKNAPYSAETVSERQQNLADGNQIVRTTSSMSYRDAAGRTRQEIRDDKGEVKAVTIRDTVAGVTYILHPQDKTATKVSGNLAMGRAAGEAARERIEQLRKEGKLPVVEHKTGPNGEEIIIKRVERPDGDAQARVQKDVRIVVQKPGEAGAPAREMNIQIGSAFNDMKWMANATTKDLGTREFDGVKAEGKLRSYEIPAGEVGNRNPIVVSDESWYAPDLQVTLYAKHSDPRSGDFVYRVQNLKRGEPAAALFTVPSDYQVKDVMANMKRKLEQKAQ
jgi:hypothetical protein